MSGWPGCKWLIRDVMGGILAVLAVFADTAAAQGVLGASGFGIALDRQGRIYTVAPNNREVWIVSASGIRMRTIPYERFHQLEGIVIRDDGSIVVSDAKGGRVYTIRESATVPGDYRIGEVAGGLVENPRGLAYTPEGILTAVDGKQIASYYSIKENQVELVGDAAGWKQIGFDNPRGVTIDGDGNAYISSPRAVYKLAVGSRQPRVVAAGTATGFGELHGLALDRDGKLLAADATEGKVWEIEPASGKVVWAATGLREPTGVTADGKGSVYVRQRDGTIVRIKSSERGNVREVLNIRLFDRARAEEASEEAFADEPECIVLARLLFGEARMYQRAMRSALTEIALTAIGWSVINRTGKGLVWGNTLHGVLLSPGQYSPLSSSSPVANEMRRPSAADGTLWSRALGISEAVVLRKAKDPIEGGTHYTWDAERPPAWARIAKPVGEYDKVLFFRVPETGVVPAVKPGQ